nr:hypothetical protein CKG001_29010 [Bdellovibrio sp. CKG001]BFD64207.1 hypothetical protein BdHM001_28880 [Bdellovibrio sp. HM001]
MFQKTLSQLKSNWPLTGFILVGLVAFISSPKSEKEDALQTVPSPASVDTYIPRGFVLVPLEISNAESLASLVGDMGGVVDLYLASNDRQKGGLKVGSKLKLLRAPLNPDQYAVLVKDTESPRLLSFNGPFIAVVQNPEEKGTEVTKSTSVPRLKVEYQN